MKRLFIALGLPPSITQEISLIVKKIKSSADQKDVDMTFAPSANWHITLAFLGEVSEEKNIKVHAVLKKFAATQEALSLSLRNLGGFPDITGARTLWVGVSSSRALLDCQHNLIKALNPLGFASENREYIPHLTIAKLRNHKNIKELVSPWIRKDFGKVVVPEIRLYESKQFGVFSKYEVVESFIFSPESKPSLQS